MQKQRRTVERSCVACRKKGAQQEFVRYVVDPDERIVVDYRSRLPGRGAYTCFERNCIIGALEQGGFERAFRRKLRPIASDEFFADVKSAISQRIFGLLGIARKAGSVVSGTSQLMAAFGRQEVQYLFVAEDASDNAGDKMIRLAEQQGVGSARYASQQLLGQISGRENRNCLGIKDKQFADLLALEVKRLQQIAGEN
jgi:predicted RNA-binding protein YlxR (DUF448 family)